MHAIEKTILLWFICSLALATGACRRSETDIVQTTTEDVGDFHVRSSDSAGVLTGYVCLEKPQYADEIVSRIVRQLANHSYRAVILDVYGREAVIGRYQWTPDALNRQATPPGNNPCQADLT